MPGRTTATLGLLALALAGGHLGPFAGTTGRFMAAVLVIVLGATELLPRSGAAHRWPSRLLAFAGFVAVASVAITRSPVPEGPVAGAALSIALVAIAARWFGRRDTACLEDLAAAGLLLAAFTLATQRVPAVWIGADAAVRAATGALGRLGGAGTILGPTVAGAPVLALVVAYLLVRAFRAGRREAAASVLALAWVVLIALVAWAAGVPLLLRGTIALRRLLGNAADGMPLPGWPSGAAVFLPLGIFAACALVIALIAPGRREAAAGGAPASVPPIVLVAGAARRPILLGLLAALFAGLAGWPAIALPGREAHPRVTFLEPGVGNWDVPTFSGQGLDRVGMFGLLPRYLEAAGFTVTKAGRAIDPPLLSESDVVVVINPVEAIPEEGRLRLEDFVAKGGGLVVLGDHTDLMGIQGPLDGLLAHYGIAYRFDSAFTPHHWRNDAGFLPGPLTRGLDDANSRFQQSTGASLAVGPGAEPVATARWGFSDAGDRDNADNAFLGDYIYQASEDLGDLPVVALARRGRGRVVAFGDTSSFQNIALPMSAPFIVRAFEVAAGGDRAVPRALRPWAIAAFALLALVAIRRRAFSRMAPERAETAAPIAAACAGLLLGLAVAGLTVRAPWPATGVTDGRLAVVDAAHHNDISLDLWTPDALAGLAMNLARNGYLPVVHRERGAALLEAAAAYVTVAPRRPFRRGEIAALRALADRGGEVILACGWEEKGPASSLLEAFGFDVAPIPLGPVPVLRKIHDPEVFNRLQVDPHFAEAWPVEGVEAGRDEVLYASGEYPIAARRPVGRGGFTLIADTRFLQNKTIEEEGAAWSGNIAFLRKVLRDRAGRAAADGSGQ